MAQEKTLDEEYENEMKVVDNTINNLENPVELKLDNDLEKNFDQSQMKEYLEKMRKMPREDLMKLLAQFNTNSELDNQDLNELTDDKRKYLLEKLKRKKMQMSARRMPKTFLEQKKQEEEKKMKEEEQKKQAEEQKKLDDEKRKRDKKQKKNAKRREKLKAREIVVESKETNESNASEVTESNASEVTETK